jgi:uncharacterized damage-inducible protein DinB
MVSADILRLHIDYTAWASRRIVEAAAQLSDDELTRDFGTADRGVLGTLSHVFAADRVWLARLEGASGALSPAGAAFPLATLQRDWPALHDRMRDWAQRLTDEAAQAPFSYSDSRGNRWTQPLWQVVFHIVNHGSHHRGQVSGFLRTMGHTPPSLDLVGYYREIQAPVK